MELNALEARVIGCLMEKEITTPEQYPLSLNTLTLACNQKSSRDPVMSLTESEVQIIIDGLAKKRLISEQSGFGSRVIKYKHRFCNTEFSGVPCCIDCFIDSSIFFDTASGFVPALVARLDTVFTKNGTIALVSPFCNRPVRSPTNFTVNWIAFFTVSGERLPAISPMPPKWS